MKSSARQMSWLDRHPAAASGLLLGVLVLAAGLRMYALDRAPLWTDELFSLQSSWGRGFFVENLPRETVLDPAPDPTRLAGAGPLAAIYATQRTDTHPPVYFLVLRGVREALEAFRPGWGDSVVAIRLTSVVASLGVIVAGYVAVSGLAGRSAGLMGALLLAVATPQIQYAQEARGYMLAACWVMCAAAATVHVAMRGPSGIRLAVLVGSVVLAVATLYLALLPLLGLAGFAMVHTRGRVRRQLLAAGVVSGVLGVAVLGPLLWEQRQHVGQRNAWLTAERPRAVGEVARELAVAATLGQIAPVQERSRWAAVGAGVLLGLLGVPVYVRVPAARPWVWMLGATLLPLAVWDWAADKTHLQQLRYTVLAGGPVMLLAASLTGRMSWLGTLLPGALVLLAGVSLPEAYRSTKEHWTLVRDYRLAGHARMGDLYVVAASGGRDWEHILYLGLSRHGRISPGEPLAVALHTDPAANAATLARAAAARGGLVLLMEYGTAAGELVPPGWERTGLQNIPSVGILQTFRPPTGADHGEMTGGTPDRE